MKMTLCSHKNGVRQMHWPSHPSLFCHRTGQRGNMHYRLWGRLRNRVDEMALGYWRVLDDDIGFVGGVCWRVVPRGPIKS